MGAFPYLQVHNLMNVYICKIVFNRELTGVPRLFRMGLMGVSSVTWVTGQVVGFFCFVFSQQCTIWEYCIQNSEVFILQEYAILYVIGYFFFFSFFKLNS